IKFTTRCNIYMNLEEYRDGRYQQRVGTPDDSPRLDLRARHFRCSTLVHTFRHGHEQEVSLVPDRWTPRTTGAREKRTGMGTASEAAEVTQPNQPSPFTYNQFEYG